MGDWRLDHKTSSYFLQHFLVAQGIEYKLVQLVFVFRTVTTAAAFPGNHSRTVAAHCYATIVAASRSCGAAASARIKAADVTAAALLVSVLVFVTAAAVVTPEGELVLASADPADYSYFESHSLALR